jgi:hypothetical protein
VFMTSTVDSAPKRNASHPDPRRSHPIGHTSCDQHALPVATQLRHSSPSDRLLRNAETRRGTGSVAHAATTSRLRLQVATGGPCRELRRDLDNGAWDTRHGELRTLDSYDAGLRLVINP